MHGFDSYEVGLAGYMCKVCGEDFPTSGTRWAHERDVCDVVHVRRGGANKENYPPQGWRPAGMDEIRREAVRAVAARLVLPDYL